MLPALQYDPSIMPSEEYFKEHQFENMMQRIESIGVRHAHEYMGRRLGEGHFSHVYVCPWDETKAIKIGEGPAGSGNMWGDGWLHYAAYSMEQRLKGSKNPLLIDVHRIYIGKNRRWFCALIDLYDRTYNDSRRRDANTEVMTRRYNAIRTVFGDRYQDRDRSGKYSNFDPEYLSWSAELFNDKNFRFDDLHNNNIMVKGNRLIITDPYGTSSYSEDTTRRLQHLGLVPFDEDLRPEKQNRDHMRGLRRMVHDEAMMEFDPFGNFMWVVPSNKELEKVAKRWLGIDPAKFNEGDNALLKELGVKSKPTKKKPELKGWKKDKAHLKGVNDAIKPKRK